MTTARRLHYSYQEYLRSLELSELKLEYCDGVIYAMAGGTPTHAELTARVIQLLGSALPPPCRVYSSDLKVRVDASDLSTFPDVTVVCGERQVAGIDANAVTNPALLVEVTSRSTEDYDRGDKLSHYRQLASLQAVLFISHRERRVTLVKRTGAGWEERELRGGEQVTLEEPRLVLQVDQLYQGVALEKP